MNIGTELSTLSMGHGIVLSVLYVECAGLIKFDFFDLCFCCSVEQINCEGNVKKFRFCMLQFHIEYRNRKGFGDSFRPSIVEEELKNR